MNCRQIFPVFSICPASHSYNSIRYSAHVTNMSSQVKSSHVTNIVCRTSQVRQQTFSISFLQSCHLHNSTPFTLFTHAYHTSGKCQCIDLKCITFVRHIACASKHLKERFRKPKEVCQSIHHVSCGLSAEREHRSKSTLGSSGRRPQRMDPTRVTLGCLNI